MFDDLSASKLLGVIIILASSLVVGCGPLQSFRTEEPIHHEPPYVDENGEVHGGVI